MDLRTLTKLTLKIAGLYFVVSAVIGITGYFAYQEARPPAWYLTTSWIYLAVGSALFWFPGAIISHVLRIEGSELEGAITARRLLEVGLALLGAYFAVAAAYGCIYILARARWFYAVSDTFGGARGPDIGPDDFATIVASVVQLALGLLLWFGRSRISAIGSENDR